MSSIPSFYEKLINKRKTFSSNINEQPIKSSKKDSQLIFAGRKREFAVPFYENINFGNDQIKQNRPITKEEKRENRPNYRSFQAFTMRPESSIPIPYIKYTNEQLNRLSNSGGCLINFCSFYFIIFQVAVLLIFCCFYFMIFLFKYFLAH